jgi:hypothetical protein
LRTLTTTRSRAKGFSKKSKAPSRVARTASETVACPLMRMTGTGGVPPPRPLSCSSSCKPRHTGQQHIGHHDLDRLRRLAVGERALDELEPGLGRLGVEYRRTLSLEDHTQVRRMLRSSSMTRIVPASPAFASSTMCAPS